MVYARPSISTVQSGQREVSKRSTRKRNVEIISKIPNIRSGKAEWTHGNYYWKFNFSSSAAESRDGYIPTNN